MIINHSTQFCVSKFVEKFQWSHSSFNDDIIKVVTNLDRVGPGGPPAGDRHPEAHGPEPEVDSVLDPGPGQPPPADEGSRQVGVRHGGGEEERGHHGADGVHG